MRRLVTVLVAMTVPPEERDALLGDLAEEYDRRLGEGISRWRAGIGYLYQALAASSYGLVARARSAVSAASAADGSFTGPTMTAAAVLSGLRQDLLYAVRSLRRTPTFTLVAGLTLAIGIGAATAIFSAVSPVLLEPLPYPHADRVLMISDFDSAGLPFAVTFGTYRELAVRSRSFETLAVADAWEPALTEVAGPPRRLVGQRVSAGYFRALGVAPSMGRDFADADTQVNAPRVTILSTGLVARHFGDAAAIIGQQINLSGDWYRVIGVMPRAFENVVAPSAEAWVPLRYRWPAPFESAEWGHHLTMVGRIPADLSIDRARQELNDIALAPVPEYPRPSWADLGQGLIVNRLQDEVTRSLKQTLVAIVGAVLLVLAIASVNVANLLLARGARRRGEFAVRAALGAGRGRLVRQLLTESLLLAAFGGLLGLAVAEVGVRALVALSPPGLPRVDAIRVDGTVFAFAVAATTLLGLLVGLVPALDASRLDRTLSVQEGSRRTTGGRHIMRRSLVIAEVALALVLLVGAGLLWRSLSRLFAVAPGFDSSHVLTMQVQEAGHRYDPDAARLQFFEQALEAIRAVPGVRSAAFTSQLPLSGDFESYGVLFQSVANDSPDEDGAAFRYVVTPDYFKTMRIPLRRGRLIDPHDRPGSFEAVLISESYAKRKFLGRDPIGQRLRLGPEIGQADRPWDIIVGVVGDVKQASLTQGPPDAFYVADGQWWWVDTVQSLVVRTDGDAAALAPAIQRAVWSVDQNQPIVRVTTLTDLVAVSEAQRHFALSVFQLFGLVALALASIGLYGVISGSVTERRREIGVRSALGASRAMILGLVVRQGLMLSGVGIVIGLGTAALASRAIATLLFGVSRVDPATYIGVVGLLAIVSAMASWLPAWRASRVDPVITLRAE